MTHSGGKPHAVGDRGQRYEVSYVDLNDAERKVFGWCETMEGAKAYCDSIDLHPSMSMAEIEDRDEDKQ